MSTPTSPSRASGRLRAAIAAIGVATIVTGIAVVALTGETEQVAGADTTTTTEAVTTTSEAVESTTTSAAPTTSTTLDPGAELAAFGAWYDSLADLDRLAFLLTFGSDEQRAQLATFLNPPPPPPAPEPAPAPAPAPEPAPAPAAAAPSSGPGNSFLACVVQRESRGNYSAVNSSSGAGGAYQFLQSTWNNTVRNAGRTDLVGVHPSNASPADQDAMAAHLLQWQGRSPWAGGGC